MKQECKAHTQVLTTVYGIDVVLRDVMTSVVVYFCTHDQH